MSYYNSAALLGGWNLQPTVYTETEVPEIQELAAKYAKRHKVPINLVMGSIKLLYTYDTLLAMGRAQEAYNLKARTITSPTGRKLWDSLRRKIHWGGASGGKKAKEARRAALRAYLGNPSLRWYGSAPPRTLNAYGPLAYRPGNALALQPFITQAKAAKAARLAAAAAAAAPVVAAAAAPVVALPEVIPESAAASPVGSPAASAAMIPEVIPAPAPALVRSGYNMLEPPMGVTDILALPPAKKGAAKRREFNDQMRKDLRMIHAMARRKAAAERLKTAAEAFGEVV